MHYLVYERDALPAAAAADAALLDERERAEHARRGAPYLAERMLLRRLMHAVAARIMAPRQLQAFRARGCPLQEFYACWCAAEALAKRAGGTIWGAAGEHPFLYGESGISPLFSLAPRVELFSPAPGYLGAVAFEP